ncbi:Bug family tripartite tricarboxylate transporter substrate binding protein [Natrialbaceae archaeon A-CW3]
MVRDTNPERRRFIKSITAASAAGVVGLSGCMSDENGDDTNGDTDADSDSNGDDSNDEFPEDDIELILPWGEGGGTDRTGRKIIDVAEQYIDGSFYASNITGGTGSVGYNEARNSEPDGHTLTLLSVPLCMYDHLGTADMNPDTFDAIMQYNFTPAALTVHEDAEYSTIEEFVSYVDENPGEVNVSNAGSGGIWHISMVALEQAADIDLTPVPYDGSGAAVQAVVSGETEATTVSQAEVEPQVTDGPLEVLAVFSEDRSDIYPDVPTMEEEGYELTMGTWRGLGTVKDTPQERIDVLHEAFHSAYEDEEFQEFMENGGFGMQYRNPDEFEDFMQSQYEDFGVLLEDLDLDE